MTYLYNTKQDIFNTVWDAMKAQNWKRSSAYAGDDYECQYRGPNGMMCAAGCLMPDSVYRKDMEGLPVSSRNVSAALVSGKVIPESLVQFAVMLQGAHDTAFSGISMEGNLRRVAAASALTVPGD